MGTLKGKIQGALVFRAQKNTMELFSSDVKQNCSHLEEKKKEPIPLYKYSSPYSS